MAGAARGKASKGSRQKPVKPLLLTRALIAKFEHRLVGYKQYDASPTPGKYAVLTYKLPRAADTEDFLRGHAERSDLQSRLSSTNPSIARIALAGFDISSSEYVVVIHIPSGGRLRPFPSSTTNHVVFARLERELCRLWASGVQFAHLNPATIFMDVTGRPVFTDLSQVVKMADTWRATLFRTYVAGARLENGYIDLATGDAVLLRRMLGKLPPVGNVSERDRAVDIARQAMWNPLPVNNNVVGT
jgi:hypothetical protein